MGLLTTSGLLMGLGLLHGSPASLMVLGAGVTRGVVRKGWKMGNFRFSWIFQNLKLGQL